MAMTPRETQCVSAPPTGWVQRMAFAALMGLGLASWVACTPTDRGEAAGAASGPAVAATAEAASGASAASTAAEAEEAEEAFGPHVTSQAELPHVTRHGEDQAGLVYSITIKQTYAITNAGLALLDAADGEGLVADDVEGDAAYQCTNKGAAWNQLTVWFPVTGLFVRGGTLARATQASGEPHAVKGLRTTWFAESKLFYTEGDKAFTFAPCVGPQLVKQGVYTEAFLKPGDVLRVAVPGQKQALELALPAENRPYGALEFANGQHAIAPMRIVLATVDVPRKRLVLQYQLTVAPQPEVRVVTLGVSQSPEQAAHEAGDGDPKAVAYQQQTQRMLNAHLATCVAPTSPIADACSQPSKVLRALHKRLVALGN